MLKCNLCHHNCNLNDGVIGFCQGRKNSGGEIKCINYGKITSMALDPIEKKPLYHFMPGSQILSIGSYGCNLRCPFCQNYSISMADDENSDFKVFTPNQIADIALGLKNQGNIGIAFTYNEPLISYEFVRDTARAVKARGLKTVCVSNGCFNVEEVEDLFELIDGWNIDLKGFSEDYYNYLKGDFNTVKNFIKEFHKHSHIEITTLIVPGLNDSVEKMENLSTFIASIDPDIPYHITRFFPRYKLTDRPSTDVNEIYHLRDIAKKHLNYVYVGNC